MYPLDIDATSAREKNDQIDYLLKLNEKLLKIDSLDYSSFEKQMNENKSGLIALFRDLQGKTIDDSMKECASLFHPIFISSLSENFFLSKENIESEISKRLLPRLEQNQLSTLLNQSLSDEELENTQKKEKVYKNAISSFDETKSLCQNAEFLKNAISKCKTRDEAISIKENLKSLLSEKRHKAEQEKESYFEALQNYEINTSILSMIKNDQIRKVSKKELAFVS